MSNSKIEKKSITPPEKNEEVKKQINNSVNPLVEEIRIKELDLELIQPSTKTFKDPEQGGSKTIVVGKPGCFIKDTPVLMFNGEIKNVQDVKVGDLIMGPDSKSRTVLELCRNRDEMFKVVPEWGEPYTVNLMHKLVIKSENLIYEMTVQEYMTIIWKNPPKIMRTAVHFREKRLPITPYQYGLGLFGNFKENAYTDKHKKFFEANDLFENPRILRDFKVNSFKNRKRLLEGILDCSISIYSIIKNIFNVICQGEVLKDDICYLARSLGLVCNKTQIGVEITGDFSEYSLKYAVGIIKPKINYLESTFKLIRLNVDDYYGFTIDRDHRFLLGTFDIVRNTGKTTLIASLLYAKKHIFPVAIAMSGTEDSNHFYRSVLPSTFVFNNYDETQVEKFIKRQKIAKDHLENPWAVIILDDCTDDASLFRKPLQNGMYKRGRHWKMWYILSLQYGMDVRPVIRTNVDGVFILREPNMRNRRVMYENYASVIPDFKLFCDILDQITNDYTALYIHNATRSNDWRECVFWYKAKPIPSDFKFGSDDYWNFHYQRYNPDYVDPITV